MVFFLFNIVIRRYDIQQIHFANSQSGITSLCLNLSVILHLPKIPCQDAQVNGVAYMK